jgi:hypothetical protein
MNRDTWRLIDQLRRIRLRLQVEAEAFTSSYCEAFMQMLMREKGDPYG